MIDGPNNNSAQHDEGDNTIASSDRLSSRNSIMQDLGLQLRADLPTFTPSNYLALLVDSWDYIQNSSRNASLFGHARGARRVYDWEGMLSGDIKLDNADDFRRTTVRENFGSAINACPQDRRYVVERFLPFEHLDENPEKALSGAIERLAARSNENSLTFVYLSSHGAPGELMFVDGALEYSSLIEQLDTIKGKKVVVCLACYSGTLTEAVIAAGRLDDYVVITSSGQGARSTNWSDDLLDEQICSHVYKRLPLNEFVPRPNEEIDVLPDTGCPSVRGGFNVTL